MTLDFFRMFDFFTGVPDSQLRPLCDYLMYTYGIDGQHHIIAANEGNAVALAAGYHLASGKTPVVYLQNSGIGNIINPVASLMNDRVYGIPCIFIVGWRGEPGVHDEPQHAYQGGVTIRLLEDMGIQTFVICKETSETELDTQMKVFSKLLAQGKQVAFVICKGALECEVKVEYKNGNALLREEIIRQVVSISGEDIIVSTTGKTSRELFEIRESNEQSHNRDFLTVGSMGHSSSVALQIALQRPDKRVWCIDGDGAALMHMGAIALIGANQPKNLIHVLINNGAHESVGGMPTVAEKVDWRMVAEGCGYPRAFLAETEREATDVLHRAAACGTLCFIEIRAAIGARADLGRPTTTPIENKMAFMGMLGNG